MTKRRLTRRQRQVRRNRIILACAAAALLIIIIVIISVSMKGCSKSKNADKNGKSTTAKVEESHRQKKMKAPVKKFHQLILILILHLQLCQEKYLHMLLLTVLNSHLL